jgi:hypothetical protein
MSPNFLRNAFRRLTITAIAPIVMTFEPFFIFPVVLITLARRGFVYILLPITAALILRATKVNYGPLTVSPTMHFNTPSIAVFAVLLVATTIASVFKPKLWRAFLVAIVVISILHAATPIESPVKGEGCNKISIELLDSETNFCFYISSAKTGKMWYYHATLHFMDSEGLVVNRVHLLTAALTFSSEVVEFRNEQGKFHAIFYSEVPIDSLKLKLCYFPETVIGSLPVVFCSSVDLEVR